MGAKFITLEGGEGAGKSTQCQLLADALRSSGLTVHVTREPGGSAGAELIRALLVKGATDRWTPMTEALLMSAARSDHVEKVIKPKLAEGTWVISDRFFDSMSAYQGAGHGLGLDAMQKLTKLAIGDFKPDLTVMMDLDVEIGMERAGIREDEDQSGEDRYERMGKDFHQSIRDGLLAIASFHPERCAIINAEHSPEQVEKDIWAAVARRFNLS